MSGCVRDGMMARIQGNRAIVPYIFGAPRPSRLRSRKRELGITRDRGMDKKENSKTEDEHDIRTGHDPFTCEPVIMEGQSLGDLCSVTISRLCTH